MVSNATEDLQDVDIAQDAFDDSNIPGGADDSDDEAPDVDELVEPLYQRHEQTEDDVDVHVRVVDNDAHAVPLTLHTFGAPPGWTAPACKSDKGEPPFGIVDNPGNWPQFIYRPRFNDKTKAYVRHSLPTGASPVPEKDGKREVNGWNFHYRGWNKATDESIPVEDRGTLFRDGATIADQFPDSRKGCLHKSSCQCSSV